MTMPAAADPAAMASTDRGSTPALDILRSLRRIVTRARECQRSRFGNSLDTNARMDTRQLRRFCVLTPGARSILEAALRRLGLSARAYDKVLRVARTLADLDEEEHIHERHVAEAVQYRSLDREVFAY